MITGYGLLELDSSQEMQEGMVIMSKNTGLSCGCRQLPAHIR